MAHLALPIDENSGGEGLHSIQLFDAAVEEHGVVDLLLASERLYLELIRFAVNRDVEDLEPAVFISMSEAIAKQ